MAFSPLQPLGVIAVNATIGGFLTAIGIGHSLADNLIVSQCIGLCIYAGCVASLRLGRSSRVRLAGVVASVPAGAIAGVTLAVSILGRDGPAWPSTMAWQSLLIGLLFGTAISTLFYLRARMAQLEGELRERELRAAVAEKEQVGAQLRMLQAQIEPHFLFNTLANLSALIRSRPELAERMLEALIAYLRVGLRRTRDADSTLGDEAELLRAYLEIIALRLGSRLEWTLDMPPELLDRRFPPLLLQPLVENAIRHGIEPRVEGGSVTVRAAIVDRRLRLSVADSGAGLGTVGQPGTGIGLDNVRHRLGALYGAGGTLDIRANESGGVTATIEVPA